MTDKEKIKYEYCAEQIILRIREEIDKVYEKFEDNPLVEQEGIMDGFEDIITEFYNNECGKGDRQDLCQDDRAKPSTDH